MAQGLLTTKRQLTLLEESVQGTYNTTLDSTPEATADFHLIDPSYTPSALRFDRGILNASLTPVQSFTPGISSVQITHSVELAGHNSNTASGNFVEPPVSRLLRGCGFESLIAIPWEVTTWDTQSYFEHGETVTGDVTGASATVIGMLNEQLDDTLYLDTVTGAFNPGEAITGGTSGTQATMTGDPASAFTAWALRLISDNTTTKSFSGIYYVDGKLIKFKGARGNPVFNFTHANRCLVTITWTGILESVTDGALMGARTINQQEPPAFVGVGWTINDDPTSGAADYTPTFNTATLDLGNTVSLRENSNSTSTGAGKGYDYACIVSRRPTLTLNPDEVLEATHPFHDHYKDGTRLYHQMKIGSTVGNSVVARMPAAQLASLTETERDDTTNWDATWDLNGGFGPDSNSIGNDNEVTFIFE